MLLLRVMSLLSLKDLRESRRHFRVVSVTLSLKAANQESMHPSPKVPFDSNISVVSVLFFWIPSAMSLAPSESILLPSKSKVVSEVFVSSNSFRYVHSALPISFDFKINEVQCV